jgi:hypothetical protein
MNSLDDQIAWTGRFNSSAPQDWELEVLPIQTAIQKMDGRLRIIWNPKAFLACPGVQDVYGRITKPIEYAGRWQVVVKGALDGEDTMILQLGSESDPKKPYRAVGWWLVDYLQQVDTANRHQAEMMQKMLDEEVKAQQAAKEKEQASRLEYLTKLYTDHCGIKALQFTGAKFAPPRSLYVE